MGQRRKILGFVGHMVCVLTTKLCPWRQSSHKQYISEWMWLDSNKTLLTKIGGGPDLVYRL